MTQPGGSDQAQWALDGLDLILEAGWLLAAILPPLAVNLWADSPFEPVKAALLRTLVWTMAAIWLLSAPAMRRLPWRRSWRNLLFWPVLAVIAVQTLATVLAVDPNLGLRGSLERSQGWLTLISYGVLFLLVAGRLRTLDQARRLALALVLPAVPLVVLGLAQALGWNPLALVTDARSPVFATLGRANFLGAYLAMLLPLTLALALSAHDRHWREAGLVLIVAELAVIGLTRTRAAWVAASMALSLFGLTFFAGVPGTRARLGRALAAAGAALSLVLAPAMVLLGLGGGSTTARLKTWVAVLDLIRTRPLLGYGPDALGLVFPSVAPWHLVYFQGRGVLVDRAHDLFLDWAVTTGIAGVVAQIALLALFVILVWRAARRAVEPDRRALLAGCLAAVGGNAAGNLFSFDSTATAAATALCMALAAGLARQEAGSAELATPARRPPIRALIVASTVLLGVGLGAGVWEANVRPTLAGAAALSSNRRAEVGNWAGAVAAAERAVALAPWEPSYHRAASWAWLQWVVRSDGDARIGLPRAEMALLAAREVRPGDFQTWAALGELCGFWGEHLDPAKLALADAAYEQATALAPTNAMLYTAWGALDLARGHYPEAQQRFAQALVLDQTDGYAFLHLGEAHLAQGHVAEALSAFELAVHWEPGLAAAHAGLARCLWLQGRVVEAELSLARALALDSTSPTGIALQREMASTP